MTKQNFTQKSNGDTLSASEWNNLTSYVNTAVDAINAGGGSAGAIDTNGVVSVNSKGNTTVSATKHVNIEPGYVANGGEGTYGDVQIKPGDDITLESHHRALDKRDEITIKTSNGQDGASKAPVKLQVIAADMTLSSKGKTEDSNVMNVNVTTGSGKGYLKVRAQAIDLRCEEHGGIALQPKGKDGQNHMNKIKFEHGGGDGLEFGTFNTEKTSIFTDEYRFNREGVWKMATRQTQASDKADVTDDTTALKYVKQADDFYDVIAQDDEQCKTKDIIKTAYAMNNDFIETSLSSKKNLKISASSTYKIIEYTGTTTGSEKTFVITDKNKSYYKDELKVILSGSTKLSDYIDTKLPFLIDGEEGAYRLSGDITPKVSIEAEEEVGLDAAYGDVVISSGDCIKCEAPEIRLNALNDNKTGGMVNFGATQDVIFINSKLTKGLKVEASATPTMVKQVLQNNSADTVYWDETESIFRVPMKKIYADAEHTIEITPSNYATYKEQAAYFADGALIPADYTCFGYVTTEDNGTYTTNVYKYSTKGSSAVLSKNYKQVGQYTSTTEGVLGSRVSLGTEDELTTLEFEFPTYAGDTNISAVQPEEFVTVAECELGDIIALVNYMKTNNEGPWTGANL